MRGSHPKKVPTLFTDWLANETADWKPTYSDLRNPVRKAVVDALWKAQRGLCVYCGRALSCDRSRTFYQIEHFRPQSKYPRMTMCFTNLFLSCNQGSIEGVRADLCGQAKDSWFDENKHIEPDYPGCTDRFRFGLTGEIMPATEGDEAAQEMIDRLNLNHQELKVEREDILWKIDAGALDISDFVPSLDRSGDRVGSYAHMVCQKFSTTIP